MEGELQPDDDLFETPADPFNKLVLNPSADEEVGNPLCPNCEEPIVPWANQHERRFNCGCDGLNQFSFNRSQA